MSEVNLVCPTCGKKKLYVNKEKGVYNCYVCAKGGQYAHLPKRIKDLVSFRSGDYTVEDIQFPAKTFSVIIPFDTVIITQHDLSMKYLYDRKIRPREGWLFCFNGKYVNRIIMPVIFKKVVVGFQARTIVDAEPKYLNSTGFPKAAVIYDYDRHDWESSVTLCEGIFDSLAFDNGVASFSKALSNAQAGLLAEKFDEITLCYDKDAEEANELAGWRLFKYGMSNVKVLELDRGDPAEHTREQLASFPRYRFLDWVARRR